MSIGKKLKELRKTNNLTQEQLANKIFISRSMIAKYETDKATPPDEILRKISKVFDVPMSELLEAEEKAIVASKGSRYISTRGKIIIASVSFVLFLIALYVVGTNVIIDRSYMETQEAWVEYDAEWAR